MSRRAIAGLAPAAVVGGVPLGAFAASMVGDANYLSRKLPSAGDLRQYTVSIWMRGAVNALQSVFQGVNDAGWQTTSYWSVGGDRLSGRSFRAGTQYMQTGDIFESSPIGTWSHWVFQLNSPAGEYVVWKDGTVVSTQAFTVNGDDVFPDPQSTWQQYIGARHGYYNIPGWDGDLYDFRYVDGLIVAPTAFGFDDSGTWRPQAYDGPFGTHGCALQFDSAGDMGLNGVSGGQNFTVNGTITQVADPPT